VTGSLCHTLGNADKIPSPSENIVQCNVRLFIFRFRTPAELISDGPPTLLCRYMDNQAPRYLADHLTAASEVAPRLRLRSANRHQLIIPRCRLTTHCLGLFPFLIWRSGTRYLMNSEIRVSEIRHVVLTVSNSS